MSRKVAVPQLQLIAAMGECEPSMAGISIFQEELEIRIFMQKTKQNKTIKPKNFNLEMLATNFKDTI